MALNCIVVMLYVIDILNYTVIDDNWGIGERTSKNSASLFTLMSIRNHSFVLQFLFEIFEPIISVNIPVRCFEEFDNFTID
jgi:hypothetical protein